MTDGSVTTQENTVDYKSTLNLPQTTFKMKAGAVTREPELQAFWEEHHVYEKVQCSKKRTNRFLLHDGPPYLSSDKIHIGTALNKILKDIVTRYKAQRGYYSPFVPGYDGHGLPIENAVVKSLKGGRSSITPFKLRKMCRDFALRNLKGQEINFKRLGVWGNWNNPYITIDGKFEATQIRMFWKMYQKGYVYKGLKPVYWCSSCETALADAEVEYADHTSESIYVRFSAGDDPPSCFPEEVKKDWTQTYFVIWTTTPWTIPSNLGLALNPDLEYVFIKTSQWGTLVVTESLMEDICHKLDLSDYRIVFKTSGSSLENIKAKHPLYNRTSLTIMGNHVTAETGTGIVHTAPGHGHEDYLIGQQYNLGILSPLNAQGVFTDEAGEHLAGLYYENGNYAVINLLKKINALMKQEKILHSYPHCWRCHKTVIYRATEQWFINIDSIRKQTLDEISKVKWIPERGEHRITSMVENRSDWCISRQRVWGVPIPVVYCLQCNTPLINDESIEKIAQCFETETSDAWWQDDTENILGEDISCVPCGHGKFTKEMDIMDVWFDSGITHTAVVEARSEELGHLPVELYLEGSDQHRGWFQSSLLTSVAVNGERPYKSVLTHGFVLDQDGRKMSKSIGNVVDPLDIIQNMGADVLRLWVASVDYTNDVRIGKEILSQLTEVYRKVRNTIRFILGNLAGFNVDTEQVKYENLSLLDKYILHRLYNVTNSLTQAFDIYEFHRYYQILQNFCVTDLSSLYFDITKDILYTARQDDSRRKAVQTVLYELLSTLTSLLVPVMPHMAEDIWLNTPLEHRPRFGFSEPPISIMLAPWPSLYSYYHDESVEDRFNAILDIKNKVNEALESCRSHGDIGSSLESSVKILPKNHKTEKLLAEISSFELSTLFITSGTEIIYKAPETFMATVNLDNDEGIIYIVKPEGYKCVRCWKFNKSVGSIPEHTKICSECFDAISMM